MDHLFRKLKLTPEEQRALCLDERLLEGAKITNADAGNSGDFNELPGLVRVSTLDYWAGIPGPTATARLKQAIAAGKNVNCCAEFGYTPLHGAAENNALQNARVLLENGANPVAKTDDDRTPIDFAEESGFAEMVSLLRSFASTP